MIAREEIKPWTVRTINRRKDLTERLFLLHCFEKYKGMICRFTFVRRENWQLERSEVSLQTACQRDILPKADWKIWFRFQPNDCPDFSVTCLAYQAVVYLSELRYNLCVCVIRASLYFIITDWPELMLHEFQFS